MSELLKIDTLDSQTTYIYIAIVVAFIFFFSDRNIGLNIVFGITVAVIFIAYLQKKKEASLEVKNTQHKVKLKQIRPKILKQDQKPFFRFIIL